MSAMSAGKEEQKWVAVLESLSKSCEHQSEFLVGIYKEVVPNWDAVVRIDGYPKAGEALAALLCFSAIEFDKEHHPDVYAGGLWLNIGFSRDKSLKPWEISMEGVEVIYKEIDGC